MKEINLDKIKEKLSLTEYKLDYENSLNKEQLEAVYSKDGAYLLEAGAGTGKTHTITFRISYLVENGINPESILLLTFTKKAAKEMKDRANRILDERCSTIYSGTYHSFSANMLRRYGSNIGIPNNFTILDQADAEDVIALVRTELKLDSKERKFLKKGALMELFSGSINKSKPIEYLLEESYPEYMGDIQDVLRCQKAYIKYKRDKYILDYDDLLVKFDELMSNSKTIAEKISSKFKYIMVDEYQDSNKLQARILKKLSKVHGNIMVVGDPNQSIYGFRGAHYENIINFTKEFEGAKTIKLFQNYRSTQSILDLSNEIMKQSDSENYNPLKSKLKQGNKPQLIFTPDGYKQSMFIVQQILELYEEGVPLKEICVLSRNAYLTAELQIMLTQANLDFVVVGGRKILDSIHIKDIISFIKLLVNPYDEVALLRVLQLHEGVGPATSKNVSAMLNLEKGFIIEEGNKKKSLEKRKYYPQIKALLDMLNSCIGKPFEAQFDRIVKYYKPLLKEIFDDYKNRENDIDMFTVIADRYKKADDFLTDITLDPSDVKLSDTTQEKECLTISTIHSAKGLEWHTVFSVYTIDGVLPSSKSLDSIEDIQEELRLLYVMVTRAKNNLIMVIPAERRSYSGIERTTISRFLSDIDNLDGVVEKAKVR